MKPTTNFQAYNSVVSRVQAGDHGLSLVAFHRRPKASEPCARPVGLLRLTSALNRKQELQYAGLRSVPLQGRSGSRPSASRKQLQCRAHQDGLESEEAGWKKRAEEAKEAGIQQTGEWKWTLNWDEVDDLIVIGSCPRSVEDMERIKHEAGAQAIMCLQSDACFKAMKIDWEPIRQRALDMDVAVSRIAVYDFDHGDQALMLPEAVRTLALHVAAGRRTYVHCTAGINRASLTVVGYLTFFKGWDLEGAERHVKKKRPQAHPYIDCWKTVHARQLEGRGEELTAVSEEMYKERCRKNEEGTSYGDWKAAETFCIKRTFERRLKLDQMTTSSLEAVVQNRGDRARAELQSQLQEAKINLDLMKVDFAQLSEEKAAVEQQKEAIAQQQASLAQHVDMLQQEMQATQKEKEDLTRLNMESASRQLQAESRATEALAAAEASSQQAAAAIEEVSKSQALAEGAQAAAAAAEATKAEAQAEVQQVMARVGEEQARAAALKNQLVAEQSKHEVEMLQLQDQLQATINSNSHFIKAGVARAESAEKRVDELEGTVSKLEQELRALRSQRAAMNLERRGLERQISNGASNHSPANGHSNGHANGHSNGHANGAVNSVMDAMGNNAVSNGATNSWSNGAAELHVSTGMDVHAFDKEALTSAAEDPLVGFCLDNPDVEECQVLWDGEPADPGMEELEGDGLGSAAEPAVE